MIWSTLKIRQFWDEVLIWQLNFSGPFFSARKSIYTNVHFTGSMMIVQRNKNNNVNKKDQKLPYRRSGSLVTMAMQVKKSLLREFLNNLCDFIRSSGRTLLVSLMWIEFLIDDWIWCTETRQPHDIKWTTEKFEEMRVQYGFKNVLDSVVYSVTACTAGRALHVYRMLEVPSICSRIILCP